MPDLWVGIEEIHLGTLVLAFESRPKVTRANVLVI